MAKLTLADARVISLKKRPWSIRMEYVGANPANQSGHSAKFWYATGRARNEAVEIGWGAIGSRPTTKLLDWAGFEAKIAERLKKDYGHRMAFWGGVALESSSSASTKRRDGPESANCTDGCKASRLNTPVEAYF